MNELLNKVQVKSSRPRKINKDVIHSVYLDNCDNATKLIIRRGPQKSSEEHSINVDDQNISETNLIKKNISIKDKLMTIDKIIEMYPHLKKDRDTIVNNVLGKKEQKVNNFILEKVSFKDISFYRDPDGNLLDSDINLIGLYLENDFEYIYHLFDDIANTNKKILSFQKILKK
jgi:hypothetical protein